MLLPPCHSRNTRYINTTFCSIQQCSTSVVHLTPYRIYYFIHPVFHLLAVGITSWMEGSSNLLTPSFSCQASLSCTLLALQVFYIKCILKCFALNITMQASCFLLTTTYLFIVLCTYLTFAVSHHP